MIIATEEDVNEHIRELAILDEYGYANISNQELLIMAERFCRTFS